MISEMGKPGGSYDDWEAHWREYASSANFNPAQAFRRDLIGELIRERAPQACRILERAKVRSVDNLSWAEECALSGFRRLLRRNHAKGRWGWQIIACARENGNR